MNPAALIAYLLVLRSAGVKGVAGVIALCQLAGLEGRAFRVQESDRCMGAMSTTLGTSTANSTNVKDHLLKLGLLAEEKGSSDRRKVLVRLTSAGRALIAKAEDAANAAREEIAP